MEDTVEIDLAHIAIFSRFVSWLDRDAKGEAPNGDAINAFCILSGKDDTSPTYYLFKGFVAGYATALKEKAQQNAPPEAPPPEIPTPESVEPLPKGQQTTIDYFAAYRKTQEGA